MKSGLAMIALLVCAAFSPMASAEESSPIEKILEMISDLQSKIIAEGTEAQKVYDEFAEWCEDRSTSLGFEIKTGKSDVAELTATIEEETSSIAALETKIEELSSSIQADEADLTAATGIREKEAADFAAEERELTTVISMLERATSILSKEMAKSGASMLQLKSATSVTDALAVMVQASVLSSADASRLTALVQSSQESTDSDSDMGAPAAAVYEGHSDGIIGTLEGLTEKAEGQLNKARKEETTAIQNYQMLKQSLSDEISYAEKDMAKAKKSMSASAEKKSAAEGDLDVTSKDLAEDVNTKATLHHDCMSGAEEFELGTKSRGEELKALATAKKVISETTGGAASQSYDLNQLSFLQRTSISSRADLAKVEVVRYIRDLARKTHAPALAQLASRMSSAMRLGAAAGEDPFMKIKSLITEMISTLEAEAEEDASQKAYCDKELSDADAKNADLTAESDKLSSSIAQKKAASAKLKEQVATLNSELASAAKAKGEADKLRAEEKAAFDKNSAEMALGIKGVKMALKVLKEYYAKADKSHDAAEGAGSGIISLLEVCESDFAGNLAKEETEEATRAEAYEQNTQENKVAKTSKESDVKYKTQEHVSLDKEVAALSGDRDTTNTELSAVNEYWAKLTDRCVAKPESYEERKKRREAEIAGLKEALEILSGTGLIQGSSRFLGFRHHY